MLTAPIVTFSAWAESKALLAKGADVFIKATTTDSGLDANAVAVGVGGVKPPMWIDRSPRFRRGGSTLQSK